MANLDPINTTEQDGAACDGCGADAVLEVHGRALCGHCLERAREEEREPEPESDGPDTGWFVIALMVGGLLCASPASAQVWPVVAGNVADAVSTEVAMARGAREMNPVLGNHRAQRLAVKAGGTALQVWAVKKLGAKHPRAAKIVSYSIGAFYGGVVVWNVSQVKR